MTRFVIVAGEASGDALGGALITALQQHFPNAAFAGVGGDRMQAAGCDLWARYDLMAVMGFAEVLGRLPALLKLRASVIRQTLDWTPDCYVGIDAPDFNLGVERRLKSKGIATAHYVSPSIWAWRRGRAAKIAASTDLIMTLFPFEPSIYEDVGGNATFVGHPMADDIPMQPDGQRARAELEIAPGDPTLAVLPGSRRGEIQRLASLFVDATALIAQRVPNLRILTPLARPAARALIAPLIEAAGLTSRWTLVEGQAQTAMIASDAVLLASGTATLEALLCKRPMVVSYRVAPATYHLVTRTGMLNSEHFALPNVLTETPVVPEVLQKEATPERLAAAVMELLTDKAAAAAQTDQFARVHQTLRLDGAERAAQAVAQLIQGQASSSSAHDPNGQ